MRAEPNPRVAYVVKRYPRFSETFIVNEILAHEAAGLDVEIFALYPPNDTHFQDVISRVRAPVTYLLADGLRAADLWTALEQAAADVPAIWRGLDAAKGSDARTVYQGALLAREVRRRGITHLHAHFATAAAEASRLASRWTRVPYTVTAHAKDIFHDDVSAPGLRRVLGDASHVVTVSDFNVSHLTESVGLPPHRVRRIYNGLDLDRFVWQDAADRGPHILGVGRFVEKKGFDDLLRACAALRRRGLTFTCELIGSGPLERELRALSSSLSLDALVHFSGPRPQQEVMDALRRAAVFAAPCVVAGDGDRDGLPTVLVEAMALGTPVVATDVVGIPEVVRHETTGLLVRERHPEELADALGRLLTSAADRQRLSAGARALVRQAFDAASNSTQLRGLFASADTAIARAS